MGMSEMEDPVGLRAKRRSNTFKHQKLAKYRREKTYFQKKKCI